MARIRSFDKGTQSIRPHDSLVDCFHNTIIDSNGDTLLHLSTFGSDYRKSAPKSSQSLQIDVTMAAQLLEVIYEAFPSLAPKSTDPFPNGGGSDSGTGGDSPIYSQLAKQLGADE
ncbi:hypothetical protein [Rhodococcus gannanensis]|uniref:Uncharacterized protein n=1 Tax=Rhodococcus gannanensis TaxID=1960308 RepID=A0ABW4P206_9NOCA